MPKVTVKCANPNCKGKGFVEVYPYRLKTTKNFFCCPECQSEFNSKPKKPQIAVKCALEGCDKVKYVTETEFKSKKNFFCCKKHHDELEKENQELKQQIGDLLLRMTMNGIKNGFGGEKQC